jgi:Fumarate hydratase (Fumerase)
MIPISRIQHIAEELMAKAAIEIPEDYLAGLRKCAETETGDLSAFVIKAMLENYEAAKEDRRAMCGDTGVPRWYVKIGNEARIEGGPVALEAALRRATARATSTVPLRPNRVHPLWRTDHNNNVGINAPEVEYAFHPEADWIELTTVHKGGLFGFRFAKWLDGWFKLSGCNIIIGKAGMTSEIYRRHFVPNHAIYLTTVGYGTGALLGRGIKGVSGVYWLDELGLAQAIWVLEVESFGPFLVESDLAGNSLFERENAKIAPGLEKLYAGTRPATLRRYGETDDKTEEVI